MKTIKYLLLLLLTISIFSCGDDEAPPCIPIVWYADADNDTLGDANVTMEACYQPDGFVGNSDDTNDTDPLNLDPIVSAKISNLHAPQIGGQGQGAESGDFTKFDFATGQVTTSDTEWDIAFRATKILLNGGNEVGITDEPERNGNAAGYVAEENFELVTSIEVNKLSQDAANTYAISGWYTYDQTTHLINPILGKTLVFKTREGKYAKVKIISYYLNEDQSDNGINNARYYTFDYVYQPNEGISSF